AYFLLFVLEQLKLNPEEIELIFIGAIEKSSNLYEIIFKYIRIKPFKKFLRHSWLDILVIFHFALIFRLREGIGAFVLVADSLKEGQTLLHEGLEVEKGVSKVLREVEIAGKVSRTSKMTRFIRIFSRFPRLLKAFSFYEVPWGKHHKKKIKAKTKINNEIKTKTKR
ncbi:MAG: DUF3822 family protein, partial [Patescibacteria group bacterium]|nr:DUF3822 family protein [Patescibacteria group bacterium]